MTNNDIPHDIQTHCGFIAIIGRPNVGKSTLMNHLLGQKLSITSRKPQTTRHKINGVLTLGDKQYIFVDTPGFQKRHINKLNTLLNQAVIGSLTQVDVILYVVEAGVFNAADMAVLDLLANINTPVILVVNKQDKLKNPLELKAYIREVQAKFFFKETITVAAKHGLGLAMVLDSVAAYLPVSEFLYATDQLTDRDTNFLVAEIIREKLFRYLGEELPYSTCVVIDSYVANAEIVKIGATILVDKENQKGIVIGQGGLKLKKIASEARVDSERLLGNKVFLQLWVKVRSGFADEATFLKQFS